MNFKRSIFVVYVVSIFITWPMAVNISHSKSKVFRCKLPADIMKAEFANEVWVYRLYDDGTINKIVKPKSIFARLKVLSQRFTKSEKKFKRPRNIFRSEITEKYPLKKSSKMRIYRSEITEKKRRKIVT